MLNAIKNARIIGVLLILFGTIDFLYGFKLLTDFLNRGNELLTEDIPSLLAAFAGPIITIIVGFGLYKSKLGSVYGIGFLVLVKIITLLWASTGVAIEVGNFVMLGILIVLFIWFYSNKQDFSK